MTAQEHALEKLRIALETGRWEFVQEAHAILDGTVNAIPERKRQEPYRLPEGMTHMARPAPASASA